VTSRLTLFSAAAAGQTTINTTVMMMMMMKQAGVTSLFLILGIFCSASWAR